MREHEVGMRFRDLAPKDMTLEQSITTDMYVSLAQQLVIMYPDSRKLAIALTNLETAYLWSLKL